MSATLPSWFVSCLTDFLASWRQELSADVARAYWDTLSDCEQADVLAAGLTLRRTTGGEWPPSASTWHQAAKALERDRRLHDTLQLGREQFWKSECERCDDTGFQLHDCTPAFRCGRRVCLQASESHVHTYVTDCPCRPTNRTYQRQRDRAHSVKRTDETERQPRKSGGWTKASEVSR